MKRKGTYRKVNKTYRKKSGEEVSKTYWMVDYYADGRRKQKMVSSEADAETWLKRFEDQHAEGGAAFFDLSQTQYNDAVEAFRLATHEQRHDLTLARAMEIAIEHTRPDPGGDRLTVREANDAFLIDCTQGRLRESTIKGYGKKLSRIEDAFGTRWIASVTKDEVDDWLASIKNLRTGQPLDPVSAGHIRTVGHSLYEFAIEKAIAKTNPFTQTRRQQRRAGAVAEDKEAGVFSVDEIEALFQSAEEHCPDFVAALALGAFGGVRTEEIQKMMWGTHVDLIKGIIRIDSKVAKKRSTRRFEIESNLLAWLRKYAPEGGKGPVSPRAHNFNYRRNKVCEKAGVVWKQNGPRHTFASCHYEVHENKEKTMKILGHNDSEVFDKHYKNTSILKQDAERHFEIYPEGHDAENIVEFPQRAARA